MAIPKHYAVFVANRGSRAGQLSAIKVGETTNYTSYLSSLQTDSAPELPVVAVRQSRTEEFNTFFTLDPEWPVQKLAALLLEHAITLGASPEALEHLSNMIPVSEEHITMATQKAAARALNAGAGKKAAPAAKKSKATEQGSSAAEAPVEDFSGQGSQDPVDKFAKAQKAPAGPKPMRETKVPAAEKPTKAPKAEKSAPAPKAEKPAKVEKPAKADKAPAAEGEKKPRGASGRFQELIMAGKMTDDEIFATVAKEFGLDDSKRSYVSWNRNFLKKQGKKVPEPVAPKTAKKA